MAVTPTYEEWLLEDGVSSWLWEGSSALGLSTTDSYADIIMEDGGSKWLWADGTANLAWAEIEDALSGPAAAVTVGVTDAGITFSVEGSGVTVDVTGPGLGIGATSAEVVAAVTDPGLILSVASAAVTAGVTDATISFIPLEAPTGFKAVRSSDYLEVVLTCDTHDVGDEYVWTRADGYRGQWTEIQTTASATHTDTGLTAGQNYTYSVRVDESTSGAKGLRALPAYVAGQFEEVN